MAPPLVKIGRSQFSVWLIARKHMKDTPHDGVRDREDRSFFPPTRCQPPVQGGQICPLRTDRPMGKLRQARAQDLIPFARFAGALFSRTLIIAWGNPRPRRETWRRTKTDHAARRGAVPKQAISIPISATIISAPR